MRTGINEVAVGSDTGRSEIAAVPDPGYLLALRQMERVGGLGASLGAVQSHLCVAIKKSRDCGLFELEAKLVTLQGDLEALTGRLNPSLLFQLDTSGS